jgi:hypothetical protein
VQFELEPGSRQIAAAAGLRVELDQAGRHAMGRRFRLIVATAPGLRRRQ